MYSIVSIGASQLITSFSPWHHSFSRVFATNTVSATPRDCVHSHANFPRLILPDLFSIPCIRPSLLWTSLLSRSPLNHHLKINWLRCPRHDASKPLDKSVILKKMHYFRCSWSTPGFPCTSTHCNLSIVLYIKQLGF